MKREAIHTDAAPAAVGPYSQAVRAGDFVFTAGQIALRADGTLNDGDVQAQTRQVLDNLTAVLDASGSSIDRVVKCTCFLADMNDFAAMNEVYQDYFSDPPPARSAIEVARLPRDVRIEIEAVALVTDR